MSYHGSKNKKQCLAVHNFNQTSTDKQLILPIDGGAS